MRPTGGRPDRLPSSSEYVRKPNLNVNQHHESHRHICLSGSGWEHGFRTVSTGSAQALLTRPRRTSGCEIDSVRTSFWESFCYVQAMLLSYPSNGPVLEE